MKDDTPNIFEEHPDYGLYDLPPIREDEPHCDFNDDTCLDCCAVVGHDNVGRPKHYNQRSVECIDWIRICLEGIQGDEAYCIGAALKYIWRYNFKNGAEDLRKAIWYLDRVAKQKEESELCE